MKEFTISGSPHVHGDESVKKIMLSVIIALMPALLVSIYFFGFDALKVVLVSVASCLLFEWLIQKYLIKGATTINDYSAVVAGLLLAMNIPTNIPVWMVVVGALVTIGLAKMSFGGLGKNPFNPALVGRVFMLISFPVEMTTWPTPHPLFSSKVVDAITGPTPLGAIKEGIKAGIPASDLVANMNYWDLIFGNQGGSMGEISAIALIIGGVFLVCRKVINWQIPVIILATVALISGSCWLIDPVHYVNPLYHLFTGGLMLGAIFMATDMATSPMSMNGKIIYAIGIGTITIIIRLWGAYPEGMSFAILLMNAVTPLINRGFKPKRFGIVK